MSEIYVHNVKIAKVSLNSENGQGNVKIELQANLSDQDAEIFDILSENKFKLVIFKNE